MWQVFVDGHSVFCEKWLLVLGIVCVICLGHGLVLLLSQSLTQKREFPWQSVWFPVIFFATSVIFRLAFVTATYVPPYFDSVEHHRIINELVTALESSTLLETLPSLTPNYYHMGFHLLAACLAFVLHANPIDTILVLGQVILAAIPIPLYFLIRAKTKSDSAAIFGTLLAGFGWYMPGFAVNWGKYPALAGLLTLEVVLTIAYFTSPKRAYRNRPLLVGLLISAVFVSTLFHTRTLVVIAISFASWFIAGKLRSWPGKVRFVSLVILLGGMLLLGILIWENSLLKLTLEPYIVDGIWVTLAVVILSPFAFAKFPQGAYFSIIFILSAFLTMFIPIDNWLPGLENQTLLDRPFVEMILYLPLSILGGLSLAGLLKFTNDKNLFPERIRPYTQLLIALIFIGFTGIMSLSDYDFYPSDCCKFVQYDDTVALDWLERNSPSDARILIASTQMHVQPAGPSANRVGTDAGIWIPALTGRNITYEHFDIDFRSEDVLEMLCQKQIEYIYIGNTDQSFKVSQLIAIKDWYIPILSLSHAQLYQVTGCFN